MDLTTSSAVNRPIISASLRLLVVCIGVRSIRCTYSEVRVPTRFVFTTNLVIFIISLRLFYALFRFPAWPCTLWVRWNLVDATETHVLPDVHAWTCTPRSGNPTRFNVRCPL